MIHKLTAWKPKTVVRVDRLVTLVNRQIKELLAKEAALPSGWYGSCDPHVELEQRRVLIGMLETVLNETGNNWGYHKLNANDDTAREYY